MPCRGGSSAPAANHQKSNTSTIDDHIVDYATEDEALTASTTELYQHNIDQQAANNSITVSNNNSSTNNNQQQQESLSDAAAQALNQLQQLHHSQSGQLKLPHIEEEEDDEFDIGMQHFHNPLLPSRIKACTIRYADVVRSLTPSPKININRIKIKSKVKSIIASTTNTNANNNNNNTASDLESSSSSTTNVSPSASKMQAEQGSIGDLQKYHSRYLKNRRHTLANVR